MPFAKVQFILKKVLPNPVFDCLYRVATTGYYARQLVADWIFYNLPQRDLDKQIIIEVLKKTRPYTMVGRGGLVATYNVIFL